MKLSEALRLGEFAAPEAHGEWLLFDKEKKVCRACAVGRLCIAAGYVPTFQREEPQHHATYAKSRYNAQYSEDKALLFSFMEQRWPWIARFNKEIGVRCALQQSISYRYESLSNPQSISQIADWIETIEPQEDGLAETAHAEITALPATEDAPALVEVSDEQ